MKIKTLYRMKLTTDDYAPVIITESWVCIHETECFYHCVPKDWPDLNMPHSGETPKQKAKRLKVLKRIHKRSSRFAFESKKQAFAHLKMLKTYQLRHLERTKDAIEQFIKKYDEIDYTKDFIDITNWNPINF